MRVNRRKCVSGIFDTFSFKISRVVLLVLSRASINYKVRYLRDTSFCIWLSGENQKNRCLDIEIQETKPKMVKI